MKHQLRKECPHCFGSGTVPVSGVYAVTWKILRAHPGSSGASLSRIVKCKPEAMNNRLVVLEEIGLATSVRDGRQRLFTATVTKEMR